MKTNSTVRSRAFDALSRLSASGGIASIAALLLRSESHLADTAANLAHLWCALLALHSLFAFIRHRYRAALVLCALLSAHIPFFSGYLQRAPYLRGNRGRTLTVQSFNVLEINRSKSEVADFLLRDPADVLLLLEINHEWREALAGLKREYPYAIVLEREELSDPSIGNFGIALYSKYPFEGGVVPATDRNLPFIAARIRIASSVVALVGVHSFAPFTKRDWQTNNELLKRALAEIDPAAPAILLGDFNSTPTGEIFQKIRKRGLLPTGRSRLFTPSLRKAGFGFVQIDHIFVTEVLGVRRDGIGPYLGSDHRPIRTEVLLPQRGKTRSD